MIKSNYLDDSNTGLFSFNVYFDLIIDKQIVGDRIIGWVASFGN